MSKCCDSNRYIALQNANEIKKLYGTTEVRTRTYRLRNFCPNLTVEIYFIFKKVGKNTLKKKQEKRPYSMNNFSYLFKDMSKNNKRLINQK